MSPNAILTLSVLIAVVVAVVGLTIWSRRRIERIARARGHSARELEQELSRD